MRVEFGKKHELPDSIQDLDAGDVFAWPNDGGISAKVPSGLFMVLNPVEGVARKCLHLSNLTIHELSANASPKAIYKQCKLIVQ